MPIVSSVARSLPPSGTASGDLSGTYPGPTVAKVNGIAVTGTPSTGYVPTATSASAATWQTAGGTQAVSITTVSLVLADFHIGTGNFDGNLVTISPVFTLQPNKHLLFALARVTQAFNDSGNVVLVLDDATNNNTVGFGADALGPGLPPAANGLVGLQGRSISDQKWNIINQPLAAQTVAADIYLASTGAANNDGTTGAITVWFYLGTP